MFAPGRRSLVFPDPRINKYPDLPMYIHSSDGRTQAFVTSTSLDFMTPKANT